MMFPSTHKANPTVINNTHKKNFIPPTVFMSFAPLVKNFIGSKNLLQNHLTPLKSAIRPNPNTTREHVNRNIGNTSTAKSMTVASAPSSHFIKPSKVNLLKSLKTLRGSPPIN